MGGNDVNKNNFFYIFTLQASGEKGKAFRQIRLEYVMHLDEYALGALALM